MDALAGVEQLTYGELAVREIDTFIVIFTLEMVASEGEDRSGRRDITLGCAWGVIGKEDVTRPHSMEYTVKSDTRIALQLSVDHARCK